AAIARRFGLPGCPGALADPADAAGGGDRRADRPRRLAVLDGRPATPVQPAQPAVGAEADVFRQVAARTEQGADQVPGGAGGGPAGALRRPRRPPGAGAPAARAGDPAQRAGGRLERLLDGLQPAADRRGGRALPDLGQPPEAADDQAGSPR
ncbi:hypothetical protein BGV06_19745, partial [Clostridioides difficile]